MTTAPTTREALNTADVCYTTCIKFATFRALMNMFLYKAYEARVDPFPLKEFSVGNFSNES